MRRLLPVLVALAAVSTATAAQAARGPSTTLHVTSYSVLYGHTVTIGGRISNHRAGVHVVLLAQRYGHAHATRAATLTTRVGGYWRFRARPPIQTDYRARVGANLGQAVRVGVAPVVSVRELRERAARRPRDGRAQLQRPQGQAPAPDGRRVAHGQPARARPALGCGDQAEPAGLVRADRHERESGRCRLPRLRKPCPSLPPVARHAAHVELQDAVRQHDHASRPR